MTTATATQPSRVERAEMLGETWRGVVQFIEDVYSARSRIVGDRAIRVMAVSNGDAFERMLQNKELALELPVIAVSPSNIDPNDGSYNRAMMRKHGIPIQLSEDSNTWTVLRVAPYTLTLQVMMVTDDVLSALRMVDRWLAHELWRMVLQFGDYSVKIKMTPDKNIQFPQPTPSSGGGDQYRIVTNLKVETYSGYVWRIPSVRSVETTLGIIKGKALSESLINNRAALDKFLGDAENVQEFATKIITKPLEDSPNNLVEP